MGVSNHLKAQVFSKYGTKISAKYDLIYRHIRSFLNEHYPDEDQFTILISGDQISDVVLNYFVDIHRFKERRNMLDEKDRVSSGKIAAFTAKWLVKFKPITIIQTSPNASNEITIFSRHINEIFATAHAELLIGKDLPKALVRELVFDFRQKKMSETQLYMTLEQCIGFYDNR